MIGRLRRPDTYLKRALKRAALKRDRAGFRSLVPSCVKSGNRCLAYFRSRCHFNERRSDGPINEWK